MTKFDIEKLSLREKLELMSILRDSLDKSRLELAQEHRDELDEALKAKEEGRLSTRSWEEAKKDMRRSLRR